MKEPEIPSNEAQRMELVRQLHILDTEVEAAYDGITYIASLICDMPTSTVTIIDDNRQWFKSIVGGTSKEDPRSYSFCAHAILGSKIFEVPDSEQDERFKDNPLVIGQPYVRAYAGVPLELKDGLNVGTLCVIDHKPHKLTEVQLQGLYYLSLQVTKLLELRLKVREVEELRKNEENIVNMLTHELRNPLTSIKGYLSIPSLSKEKYHDSNYDALIEKCLKNVSRMLHTVNQFLSYSHWKDDFWNIQKTDNDINACIREGAALAHGYAEKCGVTIELSLDETNPKIPFDFNSILNVLENLLSNAAKYSPEGSKIVISSERQDKQLKIQIQDFGVGISKTDQEKLFKPFALHNQPNRMGLKGSGLGLSVAKKVIEKHGSELKFSSEENKGTAFYFFLDIP